MISIKPRKNLTVYFLSFAVVISLLFAAWLFLGKRFEFEKPSLITEDIKILGSQSSLSFNFYDRKSGLSKTDISLTQDGKTHPLSAVTLPPGKFKSYKINVLVDPLKLKLHEGPAVLHISAKDHAFFGNQLTMEKPVQIDFGPPQISPLNTQNHISPGGTFVIVYSVSEPVMLTGIYVDQMFFKAYPISLSGKPGFITYAAMPMDAAGKPMNIRIIARDQGGNESSMAVPYLLLNKSFRSDKMMLSESFLQQKMPEFQSANPQLRAYSLLDTFIYVNNTMRENNFNTIQSVCQKTEPRQLWSETFLRMKNASPMALYGDHRTYIYDGKPVGESVHMGVDLASTAQAPIEAANNGIVLFAGPLGIYGNAVLIDHGYGLATLYSHLSSVTVKSSQQVAKGSVIGTSGLTGLAGGDHLHFGMLVGGQFVNPQEWWDPHWIKDNVLRKMEAGS